MTGMTRPHAAAVLALGGLTAAVSAWLLGVVLLLANPASARAENYGTLYGDLVLSVAALSFALVGYFLVRRLAGNVLGWPMLGCGLTVQVFGAADQYHSIAAPPAPWAGAVSARAGVLFGGLLLVAVPWLFPTGHPLSAPVAPARLGRRGRGGVRLRGAAGHPGAGGAGRPGRGQPGGAVPPR
jgi:hypothetical protein